MLFPLTILALATLAAGDCAADNCLRALRATQTPGRLEAAQSFCATFTRATVTPTAIPSYAVDACKQNQNGPLSYRISSACSCIATSSSSASATSVSATGYAPCATVSSSAAAQLATAPKATPTVVAQLAHDCLNSVPLHKDAAIAFVEQIEPYLEWQTDSAYLKNPPATYPYPPIDIFAKLASVQTNLENDVYVNEYTFQEDLYQVFAPAHDGHYVLYPDALTKAFDWGRKIALVSISPDGVSLPEIYVYGDVVGASTLNPGSLLVQINGMDASTYVQDYAYTAAFNQDKDAAYNTMFFEKAFVAAAATEGYFHNGGRVRYIYPGANTTFTFSNGTEITLNNIAYVKGNFAGVTDGASFYEVFCTGPSSSAAEVLAAVDAAAVPTPPGYPTPVIATNDTIVSGYYLDGAGFEDVAVISLLAFESESPVEFQMVAQDFFAEAVAAGKKKLVIDLSSNGGGYILQGYDLFRQLFPQIVQDGNTRFRENDQLLTIAHLYSDAIPADYNPDTASNAIINEYESFFNYRYDYNITNQPFLTFGDKFDPHYYQGDAFTNIIRWNFNDPLTTSNSTYGFGTDVTGYGSRTNFTQPFAAEDIIMLYDGYCASTCTIFSEFMRLQAGVKSIAMGGRPTAGPIQGVGGIKGTQILGFSDVYNYAQQALVSPPNSPTAEQIATLNKLTELPINRSLTTGLNVRDNILPANLNDGLPAQYVIEEADCRLYWTLPMVQDITAVWKAAAASAWNGAPCVAGALSKREVEHIAKRMVSPEESKADFLRRRAVFERMVEEEKDAFWVARHGRKVIE